MDDPKKVFEEYLAQRPLMNFSDYTQMQIETLQKLEMDMIERFKRGRDARVFFELYEAFWLWILGAYEVVRTMCQAKSCFSEQAQERLLKYKRKIAILRIPFSKQEFKGKVSLFSTKLRYQGWIRKKWICRLQLRAKHCHREP